MFLFKQTKNQFHNTAIYNNKKLYTKLYYKLIFLIQHAKNRVLFSRFIKTRQKLIKINKLNRAKNGFTKGDKIYPSEFSHNFVYVNKIKKLFFLNKNKRVRNRFIKIKIKACYSDNLYWNRWLKFYKTFRKPITNCKKKTKISFLKKNIKDSNKNLFYFFKLLKKKKTIKKITKTISNTLLFIKEGPQQKHIKYYSGIQKYSILLSLIKRQKQFFRLNIQDHTNNNLLRFAYRKMIKPQQNIMQSLFQKKINRILYYILSKKNNVNLSTVGDATRKSLVGIAWNKKFKLKKNWNYILRKFWTKKRISYLKHNLKFRPAYWRERLNQFPDAKRFLRSNRRHTLVRQKQLNINPYWFLLKNTSQNLVLHTYSLWLWKKKFRKIAFLMIYKCKNKQSKFFYKLKLVPKFFVNNIQHHTTMHKKQRKKVPWLESLLYPRSYTSHLFFPRMWRRFRRINLTKKNKLYKTYTFLLYKKWKPSLLRIKSGFFRLNHVFKRIILTYYGNVKPKKFTKIIKNNRYKKSKTDTVLGNILSRYEQNLATIVLKLNWAPTLAISIFLVKNGYFSVNNKTILNPHVPISEFDYIKQNHPIALSNILWQNWMHRPSLYKKKLLPNLIYNDKQKLAVVCEKFDVIKTANNQKQRTNAFISNWVCSSF